MLADDYKRLDAVMTQLADGERLRTTAEALAARLPSGALVLIGFSPQGVALAATCATIRNRATSWMRGDLLVSQALPKGRKAVVIDIVDAGTGWRSAIERRYPGAPVLLAESVLDPDLEGHRSVAARAAAAAR